MLWPFPINWSSSPLLRIEWLTEVQVSRDDTELASQLRDGARRKLRFETIVGETDEERVLFENMLLANQSEVFQLPWWPQQVWVTEEIVSTANMFAVSNTAGRGFVSGGAAALVNGMRSQLVTVSVPLANSVTLMAPVGSVWPAGTKLVPVFDARIQPQQTLRYLTDRVMIAEVEFDAINEWTDTYTETDDYLGLSVLQSLTDFSEDMSHEYSRNLAVFDNETGSRNWIDISNRARRTRPHRFYCAGMDEITTLFNWLAARRGRLNRFWMPTNQQDFKCTTNITSGTTQIQVANYKHLLAHGQPGRNHLFIKLRNGTVFYRRITSIVEINSNTERLTISSALGVAVATTDIEIMCYLQLMRLSSDAVEIRYDTDEHVLCAVGLTCVRDDA
jgi:hypothetical protein